MNSAICGDYVNYINGMKVCNLDCYGFLSKLEQTIHNILKSVKNPCNEDILIHVTEDVLKELENNKGYFYKCSIDNTMYYAHYRVVLDTTNYIEVHKIVKFEKNGDAYNYVC